MSSTEFKVNLNPNPATPEERAKILAKPGFGALWSDHMAHVSWNETEGWHNPEIIPFQNLSFSPAANVFHYGGEVFEGLKAYKHDDGTVWTFRPEKNAVRMQNSAHRLALPELPVDLFVESIRALVEVDKEWVPTENEASLYLRPFMIATEATMAVRPPKEVEYYLIASPSEAYFSGGVKPITVWTTTTFSRAGVGGTGAAKCGGNYASSMRGKLEAVENGAQEVCFLDAETRTYIDELSGMNVFAVYTDGRLVTPQLTGSILEGVTRDSILQIAQDLGLRAEESRLNYEELLADIEAGKVVEFFACGTAAVVNPVGAFKNPEGEFVIADGQPGEYTLKIRERLLDIQYGRVEDKYNWTYQLTK